MSAIFAHVIHLTSSDFLQNVVLRLSEIFFDCNGFIYLKNFFPIIPETSDP